MHLPSGAIAALLLAFAVSRLGVSPVTAVVGGIVFGLMVGLAIGKTHRDE